VIAEQHLALTEAFDSPGYFTEAQSKIEPSLDFVGEVFLRCNAKEVVDSCWSRAISLAEEAYGQHCRLPSIRIEGHLDATFPYILSHLQYVIGELLRNSIQAVVEKTSDCSAVPAPIDVLICEASQHIILRISDQGGGIPKEISRDLWSFSKGALSQTHLKNLSQVPKMAATMQELRSAANTNTPVSGSATREGPPYGGSLNSLTSRPPNLRLGIGLPMSRVYAEYVMWSIKQ